MRKNLAILAAAVVGFVLLCVFLVVAAAGYYVWQLRPWMPAGTAFALGHWRFDDCEFQVWQRRSVYLTEPFADGLFVRQGTNEWEAFCFDIQDNYLPKVSLEREHGQIIVHRDGENRGVCDMATHSFWRHGQTYTPTGIGNSVTPPGEWWLKK